MATLTREQVLRETGATEERLDWLAAIGILSGDGSFRPADVFRVRMVGALLDAGYEPADVEAAATHGRLQVSHLDRFGFLAPSPRSGRTFADFAAGAGGLDALTSVYDVFGLPAPDPSAPVGFEEEQLLAEFMATWGLAHDRETLVRAARLAADGTRTAAIGWPDLYEEQVASGPRGRFASGELDEFPREVVEGGVAMVALLPRLLTWLTQRYVEERIVAGIVENFEEILAVDGRTARRVPRSAQRAVVFADVSGYTHVTEERGDEAAVRIASALQRHAEEVALRHGGRLVKLLGDGAMLLFREPARGVEACVGLVDALRSEVGVAAHAGIHAGPVIERDRDIYGRTVNLAARIAGTAGPSEVVASSAVTEAVELPGISFVPVGEAELKGVAEPVALFRVVAAS